MVPRRPETLCENFGGYVGVHRDGGFAEFVSLPSGNYLNIPDALDYRSAAVAADAVNTNWHCMRERARIDPHDTVLLISAGGGLGVHGVQVAKCFGARVIAANISEEKLDLAKRWGADDTINVRATGDVAEEVKRLTGNRGVQAAIDFVGHGETFQSAIESLATGGRAVIVGAGRGSVTFDRLVSFFTSRLLPVPPFHAGRIRRDNEHNGERAGQTCYWKTRAFYGS